MISPDNPVGLAAIIPTLMLLGLGFSIEKINKKLKLGLSENQKVGVFWIVSVLFWTSVIIIVKLL